MTSSALNLGILQAKVGNIQNQADSTSIYSSGVWSFKNSSAVTSMTIDNSGNMGVGVTPSAWSAIKVIEFSGGASLGADSVGNTYYSSNAYYDGANWKYKTTNSAGNYYIAGNSHVWRIAASGTAGNNITWTEAARIDTAGTLTVGGSANAYHSFTKNISSDWSTAVINGAATTPQGLLVRYTGAAPNSGGSNFFLCLDTAGTRMNIYSNGGIANYSANNVNLSDRREKTDFAPAKSYLETICKIPVQTFKYIDQTDDDLTLGVVAQDVQAVAPELVSESNWGTAEEPKVRLSIYQTDLQYALMKCIQELSAKVDAQAAEIEALKAK